MFHLVILFSSTHSVKSVTLYALHLLPDSSFMLKFFEFHLLFPVLFAENRFPLLLIEKSADTVAFKIPKFAHL